MLKWPFPSRPKSPDPPNWDPQHPEQSLEGLRQYVEEQARREIAWYGKGARRTRRFSRAFRSLALTFTALGGLVPVLSSMGMLKPTATWLAGAGHELEIAHLGYLFLAIAGSFALFDRFFGFSSAWMRYVTTMIELEKMREGFRLEWMSLSRRLAPASTAEVQERIIEMSKSFLVQMKEKTEKETQLWVIEFQSNLAQFEKDLRSQLETSRPGAIDVRVIDGADAAEGFDLALDGMIVERITGESGSIGNVSPGLHKVTVSAQLQKRTFTASQIVNVPAAAVSRIEMSLGVKGRLGDGAKQALAAIDLSVLPDAGAVPSTEARPSNS